MGLNIKVTKSGLQFLLGSGRVFLSVSGKLHSPFVLNDKPGASLWSEAQAHVARQARKKAKPHAGMIMNVAETKCLANNIKSRGRLSENYSVANILNI